MDDFVESLENPAWSGARDVNVLYLSDSFTPHDRRFLDAIRFQGHKVWFGGSPNQKSVPPKEFDIPLWQGNVMDAAAFARDVSAYKIDVTHVGPLGRFPAAPIESLPCAVVAASWGFDVFVEIESSTGRRDDICRVLRRADALIADCLAVADRVRELEPAFTAPVIGFPWGIQLDRFRELPSKEALSLRTRFGWQENPVVVSTRTWDEVHGVETLLAAFHEAWRKSPDLRMLLVGDGPLWSVVQGRIDQLGLRSAIETPGLMRENELPAWYCTADFYVSAAVCDGTSISLLEAMACAKPVIVQDRYGNKEWVESGINGWLCDCTDIHALASAILRARSEKQAWSEIGARNRKRVFESANWDVHQLRISDAYEAAVAHHRRKSGSRVMACLI